MGELWDGADPESEEPHHPLYHTKNNPDTTRNTHQTAPNHMTQTPAATN